MGLKKKILPLLLLPFAFGIFSTLAVTLGGPLLFPGLSGETDAVDVAAWVLHAGVGFFLGFLIGVSRFNPALGFVGIFTAAIIWEIVEPGVWPITEGPFRYKETPLNSTVDVIVFMIGATVGHSFGRDR